MEKNNTSMTALVSLFARAYHSEKSDSPIYRDEYAKRLMTEEEYENVALSMKNGAAFFLPGFEGSADETLEKIVNTRLAPAVVSRAAFCFAALKNSVTSGVKQLLVLGSGYDTMPYNKEFKGKLHVFELDRKEMIEDKIIRLERAGIDHSDTTFVSCDLSKDFDKELISSGFKKDESSFVCMLGLCHYLDESEFSLLIEKLSVLLHDGGEIIFDYPAETFDSGLTVTEKLAAGAGEKMKKRYSYGEIKNILERQNFKIEKHLTAKEIEKTYFEPYNALATGTGIMTSPGDFALCKAVKK